MLFGQNIVRTWFAFLPCELGHSAGAGLGVANMETTDFPTSFLLCKNYLTLARWLTLRSCYKGSYSGCTK